MKIIGENNGKYIVEMGKGELCNLIGYYSEYAKDASTVINKAMRENAEIKVHDMYLKLYKMEENRKSVDANIESLKAVISTLEELNPIDFDGANSK